jgi:hypothetical protein
VVSAVTNFFAPKPAPKPASTLSASVIQKSLSGNTSSTGSSGGSGGGGNNSGSNNKSSGNGGGSSGGGGYYPEQDTGGANDFLSPVSAYIYNTLYRDNVNTLMDSHSNVIQKGWAGASIGAAFVFGEVKIVEDIKVFTPDQAALIDLAQNAKLRKGISNDDADTLIQWAKEYNVYYEDHTAPDLAQHFDPYKTGEPVPHIQIGTQSHIIVR